jgi:hypothetical protein
MVDDAPLPLHRHGFLEECVFTFSYSAVRSEDGEIEGVLDIATETTAQVQDRRRFALLARLNAQLIDVDSTEALAPRALPLLRQAVDDLPAVDIRLPGRPQTALDSRLPQAPPSATAEDGLVMQTDAAGRVMGVPLGASSSVAEGPALVVLLSERVPANDNYLGFVRLVAAALALALDRAAVREAERRSADAQRGLSEALQRRLLTEPPHDDRLKICVRYRPAAQEAQIGGDWYDAFTTGDGTVTLTIGDVAGDDRRRPPSWGRCATCCAESRTR